MCYFCASTDREKHELHGWHSAFALGKLTTSGAVHANKIACSEDVLSSLRQYTKEVHFTRVCLRNRAANTPEGIAFWTRSMYMYLTRKEYIPMATLVVFKFPTAEGAQTMLSTLAGLQKQQLIQIQDGAIVTWPAGASKPKTTQLSQVAATGAGALGGA